MAVQMERVGLAYTARWDDGVFISIRGIKEGQDKWVSGDVSIEYPEGRQVNKERITLNSGSHRWRMADNTAKLDSQKTWQEWLPCISRACVSALEDWQAGEPPVGLDVDLSTPYDSALLWPIVFHDKPTLLFGLESTFKSWFALDVAIDIALGMNCEQRNVLWLDYETDRRELAERMAMLCCAKGVEVPSEPVVSYRRCSGRFVDDIDPIKDIVLARKVGFVVVDSASAATRGRMNDDSTPLEFYSALRYLNVSSLVIAHQNDDEMTKKATGNRQWMAQCRVSWQVYRKKDMELDGMSKSLLLENRKDNPGPMPQQLGRILRFCRQNDRYYSVGDWAQFEESDIREMQEFRENLKYPDRIVAALKDAGRPMSIAEIADDTIIKDSVVKTTLYRLKDRRRVNVTGDRWYAVDPDGTHRSLQPQGASDDPNSLPF